MLSPLKDIPKTTYKKSKNIKYFSCYPWNASKMEKISKKKDQGWENIGTISLTSPIEAIMKKYLFLFQALKMYSLIIVDISTNAFIPNIYVSLQITIMVT